MNNLVPVTVLCTTLPKFQRNENVIPALLNIKVKADDQQLFIAPILCEASVLQKYFRRSQNIPVKGLGHPKHQRSKYLRNSEGLGEISSVLYCIMICIVNQHQHEIIFSMY